MMNYRGVYSVLLTGLLIPTTVAWSQQAAFEITDRGCLPVSNGYVGAGVSANFASSGYGYGGCDFQFRPYRTPDPFGRLPIVVSATTSPSNRYNMNLEVGSQTVYLNPGQFGYIAVPTRVGQSPLRARIIGQNPNSGTIDVRIYNLPLVNLESLPTIEGQTPPTCVDPLLDQNVEIQFTVSGGAASRGHHPQYQPALFPDEIVRRTTLKVNNQLVYNDGQVRRWNPTESGRKTFSQEMLTHTIPLTGLTNGQEISVEVSTSMTWNGFDVNNSFLGSTPLGNTVIQTYTIRIGSADVNGDNRVDDADLLQVLLDFGRTGSNLRSDTNCDDKVDDADILKVLLNFGRGSSGG